MSRKRARIRMVRNLLGQLVPSDASRAELARKSEQQDLFDHTLTDDERRARKLARQHRDEGGLDLFQDRPT